MKKSILIVGHGYLGGHLSELLESDTFDTTVTTRNRSKIVPGSPQNLNPIYFDVLDPDVEPLERFYDAIVYCIGFDAKQGATRHEVYVQGLRHFLSKLRQNPGKFIYVSSTGVYGNDVSDWIDEETCPEPTRESGQACLEAEQLLQSLSSHVDVTVLRLAGIYGPGRIPNRARIESGDLEFNTDGFLNLVHAQDAARIIKWFIDRNLILPRIETYNVSDGNPARRIDFYTTLAKLMGVTGPVTPKTLSPGGNRKNGSKRISNRKLVTETGYQFEFESYEQGLKSILQK